MGRRQGCGRTRGWAAITAPVMAAAALVAAGCGGGSDDGGTLVDAESQSPAVLNVLLPEGATAVTQRIASLVQQNLLTADERGRHVPQLAERVPTGADVRTDPLRVTFRLRPEARWSDGTPVTSADVAFTWRAITDPANKVASRAGWEQIRAVTPGRTAAGEPCPETTCLTVAFKGDYAPWRDTFSVGAAGYILPEHVLRDADLNTVWNTGGLVGSGPYTLESFEPDVRAVLRRDPDWWGAGPERDEPIERIVVEFLGSPSAAIQAVSAGEAGMAPLDPDPAQMRRAEGIEGARVRAVPSLFFEHVILNTSRAPLDDPLVRQALAYAIDRAEIVEVLLDDTISVLQSPIRPQQLGYRPAFGYYNHDPDQAEDLLREAGWSRTGNGVFTKGGRPLRIPLATDAGNALRATTARLMARQALEAGIELVPRAVPPDRLYGEALAQGEFSAVMLAFGGGLDPSLTGLLASDQIPSEENEFTGQNVYRWSDPVADTLMRRSDAQVSDAARVATLGRLQERIAEEVPLIPLYQQPNAAVHIDALEGMTENPTLAEVFWNAGEWTLGGAGG